MIKISDLKKKVILIKMHSAITKRNKKYYD